MEDTLRYPLGRFCHTTPANEQVRAARVHAIRALPAELRDAVRGLSDEQLDTPYREGGWTPRQLVHHITDASTIFYLRTKLTLAEDRPHIKSYDDDEWMKLADYRLSPEPCLLLLAGLHEKWAAILESLTEADLNRRYVHSEQGDVALDYLVAYAAWHGKHHTMQISESRRRNGW